MSFFKFRDDIPKSSGVCVVLYFLLHSFLNEDYKYFQQQYKDGHFEGDMNTDVLTDLLGCARFRMSYPRQIRLQGTVSADEIYNEI